MRVPAEISDEMFSLVWVVLGTFGKEIERIENLKVAAGAASQITADGRWEAPTVALLRQFLVDFALAKEQVKNFSLPDAQQLLRGHRREADERTIGTISPAGHDHMNVRMVMYKVTKRLNAGNRAG